MLVLLAPPVVEVRAACALPLPATVRTSCWLPAGTSDTSTSQVSCKSEGSAPPAGATMVSRQGVPPSVIRLPEALGDRPKPSMIMFWGVGWGWEGREGQGVTGWRCGLMMVPSFS